MAITHVKAAQRAVNLATCEKGDVVCVDVTDCGGGGVCTDCDLTGLPIMAILTTPNCTLLNGFTFPLIGGGLPNPSAGGSGSVVVSPPAVLCHSGGFPVTVDRIDVVVGFGCVLGRWQGSVLVTFHGSSPTVNCVWKTGAFPGFPFDVPGSCPPGFSFDFDFVDLPLHTQVPDAPCLGPATLTVA